MPILQTTSVGKHASQFFVFRIHGTEKEKLLMVDAVLVLDLEQKHSWNTLTVTWY